ncbi:phBC6A51 family helix-turn-helix protein [Sporosarcina sp. A2]|uniref:phBC6A51 family helix-turn-helix protein n=1 Tax=Sporosarcina sp. A2 TaxID=3393449 RepID=UPI003D796A01
MTKTKLSAAQLRAIEYLALPNNGGLSYAEVAAEVGVDERTLRRWRQKDAFYTELKQTIVRNTAGDLPRVMAAIPDLILKDGNAAMLRVLLQAHGMLSDKVDVTTSQKGEGSNIDDIKARLAALKATNND